MSTFPRLNPNTLRTVYLGAPGSMVRVATPNAGVAMPLSRSGVLHQAIDGSSSLTRAGRTRRTYTFLWGDQEPEDADAILAFYTGAMGDGPFCLVDPSWRNQLGHDVSNFGTSNGEVTGWSVPDGDTVPAFTTGAVVPPSGTLVWVGPTNGDVLFEGTQPAGVYTPDVDSAVAAGTAVPRLTDQPQCLSAYARVVSGTGSVRWAAYGLDGSGSTTPVDTGRTYPLTTAWQPLEVVVYPNSYGFTDPSATPYVCAALECLVDSADIQVCNPQHEIGVVKANRWVNGLGVPRVVVGDPNQVGITIWDRRSQSLVFAEV